MHQKKNLIYFTVNFERKAYQVQTSEGKYQSLMCLLSENFPVRSFGVCYGGGSCKTCGVVITEKHTGAKCFALSCEVQIDDEIANKVITV
ncbi:MAG TPA: hypothetical protein VGN63_11855 [Flavisolibacter sp.]|jgi:Na+-transporting NADH:ubiquinone oxidoreductase subunit NqrF|nr:hypothetical protein [Flavisolibacter sp.]